MNARAFPATVGTLSTNTTTLATDAVAVTVEGVTTDPVPTAGAGMLAVANTVETVTVAPLTMTGTGTDAIAVTVMGVVTVATRTATEGADAKAETVAGATAAPDPVMIVTAGMDVAAATVVAR